MTLRTRLSVAAGATVAIVLVVACAIVYAAVRSALVGAVDDNLRERRDRIVAAAEIQPGGFVIGDGRVIQKLLLSLPEEPLGGAPGTVQLVPEVGSPVGERQGLRLPGVDEAREVAAGRRSPSLGSTRVDDVHMRVLTDQLVPGLALQLARPLDEVDSTLHDLLLALLAIAAIGTATAVVAARVVADRVLAPVRELTETAERVTATRDLSQRIDTGSPDELGRLADAFNEMLGALSESVASQRQLVADASHELRTPIATLRTNIEVLRHADRLPEAEREDLLRDVTAQVEELGALVGDIVDLAREHQPGAPRDDVRFDAIVQATVERAGRLAPQVTFVHELEPSVVRGVPERLERAVANLLDNAVKWSPPEGTVEVALHDGVLTVRDHGPGISPDDLPHVFERFYRAPAARSLPGSGLGLAIVQQVAASHGGSVEAANAADGGALLTLRLPATAPER